MNFRGLLFFFFFFLILLLSVPVLLLVYAFGIILPPLNKNRLIQGIISPWNKFLIWLSGSTVEVTGHEHIPDEPVLFVANHQGMFDVALIIAYIDRLKGFIAKAELKWFPVFYHWMKLQKCILIDRVNTREAIKSIEEGVELLKKGHSLVVFPEGTRSCQQKVRRFKQGTFKLATESRVPIIPVAIINSYQIHPQNGFRLCPAQVKLKILPPLTVDNLSKEELKILHEKTKY